MTGMSSQDPVSASDHTYRENQIPPLRRFIRTMPKTFQVLGTPLTAGRDYDWADIHQKRTRKSPHARRRPRGVSARGTGGTSRTCCTVSFTARPCLLAFDGPYLNFGGVNSRSPRMP